MSRSRLEGANPMPPSRPEGGPSSGAYRSAGGARGASYVAAGRPASGTPKLRRGKGLLSKPAYASGGVSMPRAEGMGDLRAAAYPRSTAEALPRW